MKSKLRKFLFLTLCASIPLFMGILVAGCESGGDDNFGGTNETASVTNSVSSGGSDNNSSDNSSSGTSSRPTGAAPTGTQGGSSSGGSSGGDSGSGGDEKPF